MGWDTPDVYYQPEEFGLKVVDTIEWDDEAYQFNMTAVWQDEHGQFYIADDSGCSCPSPFEWATSLDKLEKVSKFEVAERLQARAESKKPDDEYSWNTQSNYERVSGEAVDAIAKIMQLGV